MCLMKLGSHRQALEALEEAVSALDGMPVSPVTSPPHGGGRGAAGKLSVKKKASLSRDLRALVTEVKTMLKEEKERQVDGGVYKSGVRGEP